MSTISRRKLADHATKRIVAGDDVSSVLRELAAYLVDSRRASEAELVVRAVEEALLAQGIVLATITSARPLTAAAKEEIETMIRGEYTNVRSVILRELVDSSLLAGVKISLPDAQLDLSAKTKLEKLVAV